MARQADRRAATVAAILAAARARFLAAGFEGASIDEIAADAGVAKGAVYHHFSSKEALFEAVLVAIQAEIGAVPPSDADRTLPDAISRFVAAVRRYLVEAAAPHRRRILLIDGPAVIGWRRWREIDDRFFAAGARTGLSAMAGLDRDAPEIAATTHLIMGAIMEAAMVCATADDPAASAETLSEALRTLLSGLPRPL